MNTIRRCPNCSSPLPPDAPGGLCPQCLLKNDWTGEPSGFESLAEPEPGRLVGGYRVVRLLGQGGMGAVYLAERAGNESRELFALKLVRPGVASDEMLRRFRREREILETLDHPHIARILDGGTTHEGLPYLVMEYVEGQPIDTYCDERRLDLNGRLSLLSLVLLPGTGWGWRSSAWLLLPR